MQTALIVFHLIVVIALAGVVLLQRSEGGGLGLGGGGGVSGFLTGRGQANALTRATAILGALFFATSLVLSLMAGSSRAPRSILDGTGGAPASSAPATAPGGTGNALQDLQRLQGGQPGAAPAPAAPTTPQVPQSR